MTQCLAIISLHHMVRFCQSKVSTRMHHSIHISRVEPRRAKRHTGPTRDKQPWQISPSRYLAQASVAFLACRRGRSFPAPPPMARVLLGGGTLAPGLTCSQHWLHLPLYRHDTVYSGHFLYRNASQITTGTVGQPGMRIAATTSRVT